MNKREPVAYSISEACDASGFGKSTIYLEIAKGKLRARKMGARTFILAVDLQDWLANTPAAESTYLGNR
jgi:excisionase family DNA binding protein